MRVCKHKHQTAFSGRADLTTGKQYSRTNPGTTPTNKLRNNAHERIPEQRPRTDLGTTPTNGPRNNAHERIPEQRPRTNFGTTFSPALVLRRKAEKRSPANRSAGCLSEASSCASDGKHFVAASKRKPAFFLFVTFFFWTPKRKSKKPYNCITASYSSGRCLPMDVTTMPKPCFAASSVRIRAMSRPFPSSR